MSKKQYYGVAISYALAFISTIVLLFCQTCEYAFIAPALVAILTFAYTATYCYEQWLQALVKLGKKFRLARPSFSAFNKNFQKKG